MRKALGALTLLSAGLLAAQSSLAQTTQADIPDDPVGPIPLANTGNSGLVLSVYSVSQAQSLVYDTGLTYSQVQRADITPDGGLVLNFGEIPNWDALTATDLRYHLTAVDGSGGATARAVLVTAALGSPAFTGDNGDVTGITGSLWGGFIANANTCLGTTIAGNPCTTLEVEDEIGWGSQFGGLLDVDATAAVGTALGFYEMVGAAPATTSTTPAIVTRYQNSLGNFGTWLLTAGGELTYNIAGPTTVVPLPAAAWLLLSGLAGLGVLRRRNAA